jgi:hypothetical protein
MQLSLWKNLAFAAQQPAGTYNPIITICSTKTGVYDPLAVSTNTSKPPDIRDNKFVLLLKGMPSAGFTSGYIINPIRPFYSQKGYVLLP